MKIEKGIKMLIVSSYPPRQCGLATFSNDIANAIKNVFGATLPIEVCALQNTISTYDYGPEVNYILPTTEVDEYRNVAEKINTREDIALVCIQHEFGLFGGEYGNHILSFILALNKPIVIVFHTVLPHPDERRKKIVHAIIDLADKVITLTHRSKEILVKEYESDPLKLLVIPHGNHNILWEEKELLKKQYNYADRVVLSTFGLISENKNIETILEALPNVIKAYPKIIYLIIGKTHPEIIKQQGEEYRTKLTDLVHDLQLDNHVLFINEYLELKKLLQYLTLSDIYLFSSKDPNQAVSGTFAYAMSSGCAVISTPIPHAVEVLTDGNGILLKSFDKPQEFTDALLQLLENEEQRVQMARNAFSAAHASSWENIAIQYRLLFDQLTNREDDLKFSYPEIRLDHIEKMTTDYGILQFSKFSEPDPESGYTLDDNARALINMVMYYNIYKEEKSMQLASIYLSYIEGIQRDDGWFDNYKDYEHYLTSQNNEVNLEDANGRAIWSLGFVIAHKDILPSDLVTRAEKCWKKRIKNIHEISSPRAIAYALKGLYHYYQSYPDPAIKASIEKFADELLHHYNINSDKNWCWYEDYMTYANNVLPEAMMFSYLVTRNPKYKKIAVVTFDFLLSNYFMKGQLKVISNRGWFKKQNERVFHGEQPIEVATTIIALDLFYEVTANQKYKEQLKLAFVWFLGNNHLKQIMYNPENGASYDGLEDKQININQGAESTLCFFKARLLMEKYIEE